MVMMNKFRKRLEQYKDVLVQRLERDDPSKESPRVIRTPRKFRQGIRSKLLFALAGQQMKDVDEAIERLDQGMYGRCIECGGRIERNRLEALPTTTQCWECLNKNK
jgi:RNA polymerase-binding transcription factor DksA